MSMAGERTASLRLHSVAFKPMGRYARYAYPIAGKRLVMPVFGKRPELGNPYGEVSFVPGEVLPDGRQKWLLERPE